MSGLMEAHTTNLGAPIVTFWEAEIIDNAHHTFFTQK